MAAHLFFAWVMMGMYDGKSRVNSHGPASSVASGCSSFACSGGSTVHCAASGGSLTLMQGQAALLMQHNLSDFYAEAQAAVNAAYESHSSRSRARG